MSKKRQAAELHANENRLSVTVDAERAEQLRMYLRDHDIGSATPQEAAGPSATFELGADVEEERARQVLEQWNREVYEG